MIIFICSYVLLFIYYLLQHIYDVTCYEMISVFWHMLHNPKHVQGTPLLFK